MQDRQLIILADDLLDMREMLNDLLTDEGYDVVCCSAGVLAFELARRLPPDLIILDLQMESRDAGVQALRQMRSNPATVRVPALVYSTDEERLRDHAADIAACDSVALRGTFRIDTLLEQVRSLIGPHERAVG
ncbi:MAG: hypothetical protein RLZZ387_1969 [Chloroflexota bacterium]|jgi:CheY-like chemotaxis protein